MILTFNKIFQHDSNFHGTRQLFHPCVSGCILYIPKHSLFFHNVMINLGSHLIGPKHIPPSSEKEALLGCKGNIRKESEIKSIQKRIFLS